MITLFILYFLFHLYCVCVVVLMPALAFTLLFSSPKDWTGPK